MQCEHGLDGGLDFPGRYDPDFLVSMITADLKPFQREGGSWLHPNSQPRGL